MSKSLLKVHKKKFSFGINVPKDWDYYYDSENENKRIWFSIKRLKVEEAGYKGFRAIIGLFYIWFAVKVK